MVAFILVLVCNCSTNPPDYPTLKIPPAPKSLENVRVALVLSGGGARGLAHAGVLEILEKNNIPVDLIVGSSAGSLIGALYADDPVAARLKQKVITLKSKDLMDPSMVSSIKMLWELNGLASGGSRRRFLLKNLEHKNFESLQIPLVVVNTDANTGEIFPLRSGPLVPALEASSALPFIFKPIVLYGKMLIDGGVASPLPVEVAQQFHPQVIIAVDISTTPDYGPVTSNYQLGNRALHISYHHLSKWQASQADIVIHPEIDQYSMFEDKCNKEMYQAGRIAAIKAIPAIRAKIARLN